MANKKNNKISSVAATNNVELPPIDPAILQMILQSQEQTKGIKVVNAIPAKPDAQQLMQEEFFERPTEDKTILNGVLSYDEAKKKTIVDQAQLASNLIDHLHWCVVDELAFVKNGEGIFVPYMSSEKKDGFVTFIVQRLFPNYKPTFKKEVVDKFTDMPKLTIDAKGATSYLRTKSGAIYITKKGVETVEDTEGYARNEFNELLFLDRQYEVKYDAKATCPRWNQFIAEVVDNDKERMIQLQQLAAFMILNKHPDLDYHDRAYILLGEGANGKSVFLNAIKNVIGSRNISSESLQDLTKKQFSAYNLLGKSVNICSELSSQYIEDTSKFKQLTSGDPISVEKKGVQGGNKEIDTFFVFASNKLPTTRDKSIAWVRRLMIIGFDADFSVSKDTSLAKQFATENAKSAIFNWALEGVVAMLNGAEPLESEYSKTAIELYERENDSIKAYLSEMKDTDFIGQWTEITFEIFADARLKGTSRPDNYRQPFVTAVKKTWPHLNNVRLKFSPNVIKPKWVDSRIAKTTTTT